MRPFEVSLFRAIVQMHDIARPVPVPFTEPSRKLPRPLPARLLIPPTVDDGMETVLGIVAIVAALADWRRERGRLSAARQPRSGARVTA